MIFIGGHFRHGEHQKIFLGKAQGLPLGCHVQGQIPEFSRGNAHPGDVFNTLGRKTLFSPGVVLPVNGNEHVRHRSQQPLRRVEQQPVFQRRAGKKVKAMSGIDHTGAMLSGVPGGKAGDQGPHRSVAVDDVVALRIDDFFQHPIGGDIFRLPGQPLKGNIVKVVAVRNPAIRRVFIVVPGGHRRFPARVLEHFQVWQMELHDVGFHHRGNKQHLFHPASLPF